jgi:hypothetical protein
MTSDSERGSSVNDSSIGCRALSILEFLLAGLLALLAAIYFANSYWCFFDQATCGMVEPVVALYAAVLAIPFALAGWLHRKRRLIPGLLALVPAVAIVAVLFGQAQSWW